MGRICAGVLVTFRIIQFLLSFVALASGAFITYEMYSLSDSAQKIEQSIQTLQDNPSNRTILAETFSLSDAHVKSDLYTLSEILVPVLHFLQGTPVRAIIISAVGLFSLLEIIYLFFAQRSKNHPRANKRSLRIVLEIFTLLLWLVSIVCSIMLAIQYGIFTVVGGVEVKAAVTFSRPILLKVLKSMAEDAAKAAAKAAASSSSEDVARTLDIVSIIPTIGGLAIASVVVSAFCLTVSFVSLIVACCMKSSQAQHTVTTPGETPMLAQYGKSPPSSTVTEVSSPWETPIVPSGPALGKTNMYTGWQQV